MKTNGTILKINILLVQKLEVCSFRFLILRSHLLDEANKDRIFSNLLQELRTARDFNRQLCLELHKANMKLHLTQQHANEHQPGSMAGEIDYGFIIHYWLHMFCFIQHL